MKQKTMEENMESCIFCKIISGEVPCHTIYEDDEVIAFLDVSQDVYGHTLVVPKKHVKNILDCDEELLNKVMAVVQKISKHYVENCGIKGVVVTNNNNYEAGQSVFHLHFHILPRMDAKENRHAKAGSIKISLADQERHLRM